MTSETNRRLMVYAFASTSLVGQPDLLNCLVPFFRPILKEAGNAFLKVEYLTKRVNELYHWNLTSDVVEEVIPRIEKAGLVTEVVKNRKIVGYTVQAEEVNRPVAEEGKVLADLESLSGAFEMFHRNIAEGNLAGLGEVDYQEALLNWIVNNDKISEPATGAHHSIQISETSRQKQLNYLCARFVQFLGEDNPELFDCIRGICSVAFLTEIANDFRVPVGNTRKLDRLTIFLDSPFLLSALRLCGEIRYKNAITLIDRLTTAGAVVAVMPHSCDEGRRSVLAALKKPLAIANGPTADAIRRNELLPAFAKSVAESITDHLPDLEIVYDSFSRSIRDADDPAFSNKLIDDLSADFPWEKGEAKENDALSVAKIMRLRKRRGSTDPFASHALLVSRNPYMCFIAKRFCVKNGIARGEWVGPAITQRQLAALLWVTFGASEKNFEEIPAAYLNSACDNVLRSSPRVVDEARKRASDISSSLLSQVDALMSKPRSMQALMDVTLGSEAVIGGDNIKEIIEAMERGAEEKYKEFAEKEIWEKTQKFESDHIEMERSLSNTTNLLTEAQEGVRAAREKDILQVDSILARAENFGKRKKKQTRFALTIFTICGAIAAGFSGKFAAMNDGVMISGLAAFTGMVFALWQIWSDGVSRFGQAWLDKKEMEFCARQLSQAGRGDLIPELENTFHQRKSSNRS